MITIETIREIASDLPHVTEDVKWGADLCFCIGEKMFCVTGLEGAFGLSFKVDAEQFEELSCRKGFGPAPYLARHHWVKVDDAKCVSKSELKNLITRSYELVRDKLPAKVKKQIGY
jgi:predicted DNA-binding protein (MmcQ/YjbR family)